MSKNVIHLKRVPPVHPEAEGKSLTCGSCQWFLSGFNGETCQKSREVNFDTLACVEFTPPLEDPFYAIISDKYLQGIKKEFLHPRFRIDDSILTELKSYVIEKDFSKSKYGTLQDLEEINLTLKKIILWRSRVSNIYTSILDTKYEYEELMNHVNLWLYSKYAIMRDLKNENLRKAALQRVIPEMIEVTKNLDKSIATSKYIDEYLNHIERTLIKILDSSEKLWFSKERIPKSQML